MNDFDLLLQRVRSAAAESENLRDPVALQRLDAAEQQLGFRLHPLLAALYTTVGNGGFGPRDALFELCDAALSDSMETALGNYTLASADHSDPVLSWPAGVLPILDWGCGMLACVDCRSADGTVLLFEPNALDGEDASTVWFVDSPSLAEWLRTWLDRRGWYEDDQMDETSDMRLWPEAANRLG
ncbi:glucan biosynthesis protein [Kitasatospora sp. MMS16-BH015]|uniref:SMI1/KNR4 family protein n=1 Tax=Kitasatospora sp. MMS16-BH015 TaxID=2018025 RepID=UPI000CA0C94B|nr:SMI1/KNR4 family protein [Kitasatospora sp. MMS16-BH015]AUG81831.1 glucan biosynthesis protein [Kitasatospora sp. MMS16-BH015]